VRVDSGALGFVDRLYFFTRIRWGQAIAIERLLAWAERSVSFDVLDLGLDLNLNRAKAVRGRLMAL
jgi:hypothetical protein